MIMVGNLERASIALYDTFKFCYNFTREEIELVFWDVVPGALLSGMKKIIKQILFTSFILFVYRWNTMDKFYWGY